MERKIFKIKLRKKIELNYIKLHENSKINNIKIKINGNKTINFN